MSNKNDDCGCEDKINLEKLKINAESYLDKNLKTNRSNINNKIQELERKRFGHMFTSNYKKKNRGMVEKEDGIEIMLKDDKNTIVFIQTYLMGDPSLWKINDNYNKALKGQKKLNIMILIKSF